jgi:hypothetical protein
MRSGPAWILIVIAACASNDSTAPSADAPTADARTTCVASSADGFASCGALVQAGVVSTIEVQGTIVCSTADCRIALTGRSVTIRGVAGGSIRRVDHHDGPLIHLVNAPAVTIVDLTIDEDGDVSCVPVSPTNPPVDNPACGRTVDIFGSASVTIDHVTIAASKSISVFLNTCASVLVSHTRFIAPLQFGLEITGPGTRSVTVEDTLFWHASSNAMVLYDAHGSAGTPLTITRTLFDHNHRDDVYYVCGPQSNQKCTGGQLLLSGLVDHLRVENSVIRDGSTDTDPTVPAGGVEINTPMIQDITFAADDVHTHGMSGIYANYGAADLARFSFEQSKLYDNGKDPAYLGSDIGGFPEGVVTESGSCHEAGCSRVRFGGLWALPGGAVGWATNDVDAPQVTVNGAPVSTLPNGQTAAAAGALVILFDGGTELDRLTVP